MTDNDPDPTAAYVAAEEALTTLINTPLTELESLILWFDEEGQASEDQQACAVAGLLAGAVRFVAMAHRVAGGLPAMD